MALSVFYIFAEQVAARVVNTGVKIAKTLKEAIVPELESLAGEKHFNMGKSKAISALELVLEEGFGMYENAATVELPIRPASPAFLSERFCVRRRRPGACLMSWPRPIHVPVVSLPCPCLCTCRR